MAMYVSVPCKRGWEVDVVKPLKSFIEEQYGNDQSERHAGSLEEFQNMRNKALTKAGDRHEASVNVLARYYDQICALESKVLIAENGVRIEFKWQDAFAKDSLFGAKSTLKISSSGYERMCILFNMAALYSQVGESQNFTDDKGLQAGVKFFQHAAGIFSYLKSMVTAVIQREPTPDMNSDTLGALAALMLAQAQDCIYQKASKDRMKAMIVAKIAQQAADLYNEAHKLLQMNSIKSLWPKDWTGLVGGKQAGFQALAEYHQSRACADSHSYGEQIARLKKAGELMKVAASKGGSNFLYRDDQERIRRDLETAEKENNMIYHDSVPDPKSLSAVGKAAVAKELPPGCPMSADFKDLFEKLVPMAVHGALMQFENEKKNMANMEIGRLRETTELLNTVMASLNLPASLEDTTGSAIPPSILEKSAKIRQAGGIDRLKEMMQNLPDLLQRNKEIMNESIRMLDEEQESDTKLRAQFKDRWTRTPSEKLTEAWRAEANKFNQILTQATSSDGVVREKFNTHERVISILSKTEGELKAALPKGPSGSGGGNEGAKQVLRQMCDQVETLKMDRKALETQISEIDSEGIAQRFTEALAQDGALGEQQMGPEELNRLFEPLREQVRDSVNKQESLLAEIQAKNTEYLGGGSGGGAGQERANLLRDMATAYDQFEQLRSNLEEGTKFYSDLTQILIKFQNKVQDFCFARKTEKEELMKDMQSTIVQERTPVAPQASASAPSGAPQDSRSGAPPPSRPPPTYMAPPPQQQQQHQQPQAQPPASTAPQAPPYGGQQPPPMAAQAGYGAPNVPYPISPYGMPQAPSYTAGAPPPMPSYMAGGGGYGGYPPQGGYYQPPPQGYATYPGPHQQNPYGQPPAGYPYPQQQQQQPYNPQWRPPY